MLIVVVVWTGCEARALRTALRMTVLGFAEHLGVGSRTVSDWEAGRAEMVPTPAMQAVLDTALSRAADEAKIRFVELTSGNPVVCVSDSPGRNGNGEHTDRRQAGKAIVVGGFTALFPREAVERIIHHGNRPVDARLLAAHEDLADVFAERHHSTPHEVLLDQVAHQAGKLLWLLDRPMATAERRRLDAIVVASHVHAGLLAFNLAARAAARGYFATAQSVADDANDDALRAQALVGSRTLRTSIESGGRAVPPGGRVVELMREAADLSRRADPDTCAYVHAWLGLELAAANDERGFLTAYETAERLAQHTGHGEGRGFLARRMLSWRLQPEQAANKGIGLVRVGGTDEALNALMPALDPSDPGWAAIVLADIALARVSQGEPEQACQDLQHALDLALNAGYAMGVERIRGVRARFPEPWKTLACVLELDERLTFAS